MICDLEDYKLWETVFTLYLAKAFFMLAPQVQSVSVCLRCASRVRSIQCLGLDQMCNVTAHDLRDLAKWGAWMSYGSRSVQRCVSWVHADDKNIIPNPFFLSSLHWDIGDFKLNLVSSYEYVFWHRVVEEMSNLRKKVWLRSSSCWWQTWQWTGQDVMLGEPLFRNCFESPRWMVSC